MRHVPDSVAIWRVEHDVHGGPEVLQRREALLAPPGPGEVRVAMRAASVNPVDGKIRAGLLKGLPSSFPAGTGRDGAGVVVALGAGVEVEWLGRRVAFLAQRGSAGSWASETILPVGLLTAVPDAVDDLAAAALPLAGLSAAAVARAGGIGIGQRAPGMRVLIHGAAGGVGRIALQLARAAGAVVHATASAANRTALERLGAYRVWARETDDFTVLHDLDLVIDLVGGAVHERSYQVLRPGGLIACLNAAPFADRAAAWGLRCVTAEVAPDPTVLSALLALVAAGELDPGPTRVLPGADFTLAQSLCDSGQLHGKLVLDFRS